MPAIRNLVNAKLNGGKLTNPTFVTVAVAPVNIDATRTKIIAFCLSFIS